MVIIQLSKLKPNILHPDELQIMLHRHKTLIRDCLSYVMIIHSFIFHFSISALEQLLSAITYFILPFPIGAILAVYDLYIDKMV